METNQTPTFDTSDNSTGCCPRFDPAGWDEQELHFENKPFVHASTVSLFHVPLNMGSVFSRTWEAIERAHANDRQFLVLSHDDSPWHAEHYFAVDDDVPGAEMVRMSGDFFTKVFEGPFSQVKHWCAEMESTVGKRGREIDTLYYFYTTCPKCAKVYGKNYVVAVAKLD